MFIAHSRRTHHFKKKKLYTFIISLIRYAKYNFVYLRIHSILINLIMNLFNHKPTTQYSYIMYNNTYYCAPMYTGPL